MAETAAITVLLVDADSARSANLRNGLQQAEPSWQFAVATSTTGALEEMGRRAQVDAVVVCDDGLDADAAGLFRSARWHHPECVRLIVSYEHESIARVAEAQQFLHGPTPAAVLESIIRRVEIRRRLTDPALRRLVSDIATLPSPPTQVMRLNEVLAGPEPSVDAIAAIVGTNPAMTAKLLQLVNSGFFGLQTRITEVSRAVAYLGLETTRNILSALELVRSFDAPTAELRGALENLHTHSLTVAELARKFLSELRHPAHDAFTGGLLHDIGLFALLGAAPERFTALRDTVMNTGLSVSECEVDVLGARHAHLGAYLLTLWGLPEHLVETVARSHDADFLPNHSLSPVHAVYVAEQLSNLRDPHGPSWEGGILPEHDYLVDLGLDKLVSELIGRVEF